MPRNRLQRIVPSKLAALATTLARGVGPVAPNRFSVDQSAIDRLHDARIDQAEAARALTAAEAAYHAAVRHHETARAALADVASAVANVCYAAPDVTPGMIAELGLSPRSPSRTRAMPEPVISLTALPQPNGNVVVRFDRGDNPEGVTFVLETRVGTEGWRFLLSTRRTRLSVPAVGRGETRSFRVIASANERSAPPSNVATIFA